MSELEPIPDVNMSDVVMPSGFRRVDLVRLITQCLSTLGYANAAQVLQQDSGVLLLAEPIVRFKGAVLNGEWQEASSLVESLGSSRSGAPNDMVSVWTSRWPRT